MEGGEISGNTAQGGKGQQGGGVIGAYGGGVTVDNGGTFTMKGGKIAGNSANSSVENSESRVPLQAMGGGVYVQGDDGDSVFTMEGGEIAGNSVTVKASGDGGGVRVARGTFTMSGGIISGNTVSGKRATGGGVSSGDIFTMLGGTISGNSTSGSVSSFGGGVFLLQQRGGAGKFTMEGGTIYGSDASANSGGNANETRDGSGAPVSGGGAAIAINPVDRVEIAAKWGSGGAYTKGGAAQTGGSDIGNSDATLIAIPAK
jgi:hypothetical protein